jgi:hypothetical protein
MIVQLLREIEWHKLPVILAALVVAAIPVVIFIAILFSRRGNKE